MVVAIIQEMSEDYLRLVPYLACSAALASMSYVCGTYRSKREPKIENIPAKIYPVELQDEMFSRVKTFFGEEGLNKLKDSYVVVRMLRYNLSQLKFIVCRFVRWLA